MDVRRTLEGLDLDRDPLASLLGGQEALRSQIDEDVLLPEGERVGIVGDQPSLTSAFLTLWW